MRHLIHGRKLNADTQHRLAMRRNLARSLILHGRIVTTTAKAKFARPFAERLITRARHALAAKSAGEKARWLHLVRLLVRDLPDREVLTLLLSEVAPRANRPGGYTRIVRDWKNQVGDNAPRSIWELVDRPAPEAEPEEPTGKASDEAKGSKGKPAKGAKAPKAEKAEKPAKAEKAAAGEKKKRGASGKATAE